MMVRILIVSALVGMLLACSNQRWNPDDYPVSSGDTIYSIAWKYELDPFELARWNNISSPYRIYPGQRLAMKPGQSATASQASTPKSTSTAASRPGSITVRKGDTLNALAHQYSVSARQLASINGLKPPYIIKTGQTLKLTAAKTRPAPTTTSSKATSSASASRKTSVTSMSADNKNIIWQWPVKGRLITTFKSNKTGRKGIDIAGKEGAGIRAAAAGKVVYSGNGLISYGNLVIIKHNRSYLSAYAHNRKLLVKEGETIKAGQKIAELGKTGADSPRLHFEIRKNGKPVNPLKYLPSS
jgi:lipoprotein NlpD